MVRLGLASLALALAACDGPGEAPLFEQRSSRETGITFVNRLQEDDSVFNAINFDYLYNGGGVAAGDFNNDGLQDLYFTGNMVSSRLYLNRGGLKFDDVTEAAGAGTDVWATGVSLVDINQDGLLDIYVSVAGKVDEARRANLLFVNQGMDGNGVPRFVEQAAKYGIADTGYSTHAVFFDYDLDGDLDLYNLTNALEEFSRNQIRPKLVNGEAASTDRLYRNNGDGTFTNVSREAGILTEGYGLGVVVSDINQDGWPDIYVANDFNSNDIIWVNNGDGTFSDRASRYLKHQTHNSMGTDIADIDDNGLPDIVVVDMLPEDNLRQKLMLAGSNYDTFQMSLYYGYAPQYVRNTLQVNNGPGPDGEPTFSEVGQLAGVHNTDWSWAALFADLDNDGRRDLFISNGYRRDVTNLDFIVYSKQSQSTSDPVERKKELLKAMRELPEVKIPNYVYQNQGDLSFVDRSEAWGLKIPSFSNGAAYADLDNDGDLDLVVNNLDEEAFLFENRASERPDRNFFRVSLRGPRGNRPGYGAKLVVHSGGQKQHHEHTPYRGYKSTMEGIAHFGLGAASRVDSLEIRWPDGTYQLLTDLPANQVVTLDHRNAAPHAPAPAQRPAPLFRAAAAGEGLEFLHMERDLADFKHTPLLPHKLSNSGPGLAVGDVDGNGLDDVYVGTDRGQPKTLYVQTAPGRFEKRGIAGDEEYEDMGALLFDADADGDLDLYAVSGGGFLGEELFYQDRLYLNDGRGNLKRDRQALPTETASGSTVVAADYDGDGDLDLFVGGRVLPGKYPLPARSYLLRNDTRPGGPARFTDVTEELAPGLSEVGLVTAALWTDFDQDGGVDLLLTGEWMPLTFFRNRQGRFQNVTAATGLGETNGWWNSLVAGDFDRDGDTDYIAGNLGLNSRFRASVDEPVRVHAADYDESGSMDPVLSHYIGGRSYPVASRDVMIDQIIGMKGRFPRYTDYANATLENTLSRKERNSAFVARSVTFASSYLENLGGGKFAIRPLPRRAQVAPTFGMLTGDYDGDGNLDVLMVGNSRATETQTGWYEGSIGAVLLGDGKGGFAFRNGTESGFFVDGDAKGIAEVMLDGSRSLFLVTQNNDSLKTFVTASNRQGRALRLEPGDAYAVLRFADGTTRRDEFHYGSTYLSQSSRCTTIPSGVTQVTVYDFAGRARTPRL